MSSKGKAKKKSSKKKGSSKGKPKSVEKKPTSTATGDAIFEYDPKKIDQMRKDKPWEKDEKYFNTCSISALAAMKMLKHSLAGVTKGRNSPGGQPIEIMGLLVGKPEGNTIVVMDAFPLPVEGIEYKVEAAESAQTHMIELLEALEQRRQERFVGWYHSHPFDVDTKSNAFMSAMDVGTQTSWQNSIKQWTAIVIDPLRSLAKQQPELGVFRVYNAAYTPPGFEGPDGTMYPDDATRALRWGAAASRYYCLKQEYFMSGLGKKYLDIMSRNNLWVRVLSSSTVMEPENRLRFSERIKKASDKLQGASLSQQTGGGGGRRKGAWRAPKNEKLVEGDTACAELALEQCCGHAAQMSKNMLFNYIKAAEERYVAQHGGD